MYKRLRLMERRQINYSRDLTDERGSEIQEPSDFNACSNELVGKKQLPS